MEVCDRCGANTVNERVDGKPLFCDDCGGDVVEGGVTSVETPEDAGILEKITEPLRKKEGFRHLWLGDSGQGKTVANDQTLRWIRKRRLVDVTLTIDDKN